MEPAAQAVTTQEVAPFKPQSIATCPAARLAKAIGIKNGETLEAPLSLNVCEANSIDSIPPIPEPMMHPKRSASEISLSNPASCIACLEAIRANCVKRSLNFRSRLEK